AGKSLLAIDAPIVVPVNNPVKPIVGLNREAAIDKIMSRIEVWSDIESRNANLCIVSISNK
ncbi:hypothetical protein AAEI00_21860, partial [Shewanella algae]|uniref:hypothetical protein n=1 Tax=Shewanella algae TaxID=38313 RepID=UPI0031918C64